MKFITNLLFGSLLTGSAIFAHNYDHLKIEELKLIVLEQEHKLAHKDKVIDTQTKIVIALEEEIKHLKHEVRRESRYHELKKILKSLVL
ncbi:hypothetical protein BH09DEP1_BH09DEP1_8120 [soil metagenome]